MIAFCCASWYPSNLGSLSSKALASQGGVCYLTEVGGEAGGQGLVRSFQGSVHSFVFYFLVQEGFHLVQGCFGMGLGASVGFWSRGHLGGELLGLDKHWGQVRRGRDEVEVHWPMGDQGVLLEDFGLTHVLLETI